MSPSETARGAREQWASRTGFLLATIGGAVGLGNVWRFSYVAGENGGAAFLLVYLVFVAMIGVPLVIAELVIGRHARADAVAAFGAAPGSERWRLVGCLGVLAATLMLSYYAVIAGWALKYFAGAATGGLWRVTGAEFGGYFRGFIADPGQPVAWQAATLLITMVVVAGGVQAGIERVNRLLIPILAVIVVVLAGFALTLPGSAAGVRFLFAPDWTALREPKVYAAALGQAFFSLGLGVAFFVTYGSYMPRTFPLATSAAIVAASDTMFAIVAGLAIFPAVFALRGDAAAGPELAFITLPRIFAEMPGGVVVGAVFFGLLAIAAITSMMGLLEIPVATLAHRLGLSRRRATAFMGAGVFVLGLPSALSYGALSDLRLGSRGILDAIDHGVSTLLLPAVGIGAALFTGWRLDKALVLAQADFGGSRLGIVWLWLVRLVVPIMTLGILLQSVGAL